MTVKVSDIIMFSRLSAADRAKFTASLSPQLINNLRPYKRPSLRDHSEYTNDSTRKLIIVRSCLSMPPNNTQPGLRHRAGQILELWRLFSYAVFVLFLLVLLLPGFFIPIFGDLFYPPRSAKPPKLPYGLSLVDTVDTLGPKTAE